MTSQTPDESSWRGEGSVVLRELLRAEFVFVCWFVAAFALGPALMVAWWGLGCNASIFFAGIAVEALLILAGLILVLRHMAAASAALYRVAARRSDSSTRSVVAHTLTTVSLVAFVLATASWWLLWAWFAVVGCH